MSTPCRAEEAAAAEACSLAGWLARCTKMDGATSSSDEMQGEPAQKQEEVDVEVMDVEEKDDDEDGEEEQQQQHDADNGGGGDSDGDEQGAEEEGESPRAGVAAAASAAEQSSAGSAQSNGRGKDEAGAAADPLVRFYFWNFCSRWKRVIVHPDRLRTGIQRRPSRFRSN